MTMNERYECTIKGIPSICEVSVHHPPPGDRQIVLLKEPQENKGASLTDESSWPDFAHEIIKGFPLWPLVAHFIIAPEEKKWICVQLKWNGKTMEFENRDPLLVQMEPLVLYESENITDGHIINDR